MSLFIGRGGGGGGIAGRWGEGMGGGETKLQDKGHTHNRLDRTLSVGWYLEPSQP